MNTARLPVPTPEQQSSACIGCGVAFSAEVPCCCDSRTELREWGEYHVDGRCRACCQDHNGVSAAKAQQSSASRRDTILLEAHAAIERAEYPEAIDNTKHYYFGHVDRMHLAQTISFDDRLKARDCIDRFAADAQMAYRGRVQRVKAGAAA